MRYILATSNSQKINTDDVCRETPTSSVNFILFSHKRKQFLTFSNVFIPYSSTFVASALRRTHTKPFLSPT